jgi:hypothetical protein
VIKKPAERVTRKKRPKRKPLPRRSKFGNSIVTIDGIKFRSKREARRYEELKLLQRLNHISDLKLQPRFALVQEVTYVADFEYYDRLRGQVVVEDVKGYRTRQYLQKKKLMKRQHNIDVLET